MEEILVEGLSFTYAGSEKKALDNVSLRVQKGELCVLCGTNGSGKSTMLSALCPPIAPNGRYTGKATVGGIPLDFMTNDEAAGIGFVPQDADEALVCDHVWHELAFSSENRGVPSDKIRARVAETAAYFGIAHLFKRTCASLSGGEKKLVSLAAAMVAGPRILLVDEPFAGLDPVAAARFAEILLSVRDDTGATVIVAEHRPGLFLARADSMAVLENGRITASGPPEDCVKTLFAAGSPMTAALPCETRLWGMLDAKGGVPFTVPAGRKMLQSAAPDGTVYRYTAKENVGETALTVKNVTFRYEQAGRDVLRDVSFGIPAGRLTAVVGAGGEGKSTLLSLLAGALKPLSGKIARAGGRIAYLPQQPSLLFGKETVRDELLAAYGDKKSAEESTKRFGLDNLTDRSPFDLSGGEQTRAALAMLAAKKPDILLLDEPTANVDACFKRMLAGMLAAFLARGGTIVMVTHDMDFAAETADRVLMLFDGGVLYDGDARTFFLANRTFTSRARILARDIVENAVTAEEIAQAIGGGIPGNGETPDETTKTGIPELTASGIPEKENSTGIPAAEKRENKPEKRVVFALLLPFVTAATVLAGSLVLHDRKYYFISLLVILETLAAAVYRYDRRRPSATETVTVAAVTALAVAGRAAFYMLPQFKAVTAVVMAAGFSLGAANGFFVGALAGFVSNFLFGQGVWTPYQMFGFGLCGFVAGFIGRARLIPPKRLPLAALGFAAVMFLYGPVVNFGDALTRFPQPNTGLVVTSFAAGLPFDLIHAFATALFLALGGPGLIAKLERMKRKYGIFS